MSDGLHNIRKNFMKNIEMNTIVTNFLFYFHKKKYLDHRKVKNNESSHQKRIY